MKLKMNEKRKNVEKEPAYISKEGIVLILEVDGLEVRVKTNEGVEVGFAKVILIPMDTGEKL